MLTRIVFSCFLWIIIGRWIYEEVKILAPSAIPAVDYVLENVQIPTHDKWSKEKFEKVFATLSEKTASIF